MNAKEAINILAKMQNYDSKRNVEALEIAISALEKVPVLEAENARLANLLNNANQALKRAGSFAQFHLKADDIPTGTIVFVEKEHPEDVFVEQYIEELNHRIGLLKIEVRNLRIRNEVLQTCIKKIKKTYSTLQMAKDAIAEEFNKLSERLQKENIKLKNSNATYEQNNNFLIKIFLGALPMSIAAIDVIKERQRQVVEEKFSAEHDDKYFNEELSTAAACYALTDEARDCMVSVENLCLKQYEKGLLKEFIWPFKKEWWKPSPDNRRRELIKAAALIVAEIERLDRKAEAKNEKG